MKIRSRDGLAAKGLLNGLVTHYKLWYVTYLHKCECFFSNLWKLKSVTAIKLSQNNKRITSSCLNNHKVTKSTSNTKRHCVSVSRMKLLTSGDIKLNPGPEQNLNSQTKLSVGSTMLLNLDWDQLILTIKATVFFFPSSFSSVIWWSQSSRTH